MFLKGGQMWQCRGATPLAQEVDHLENDSQIGRAQQSDQPIVHLRIVRLAVQLERVNQTAGSLAPFERTFNDPPQPVRDGRIVKMQPLDLVENLQSHVFALAAECVGKFVGIKRFAAVGGFGPFSGALSSPIGGPIGWRSLTDGLLYGRRRNNLRVLSNKASADK
jgi:hypothetical protein